MYYRAIRGATTVVENKTQSILDETKQLLNKMMSDNQVDSEDIISIFFTSTYDLNASFPAKAARELGLVDTPLMCAQELDVKGALPQCIRVMMHIASSKLKAEIKHIYLNKAIALRSDQKQV